MPDGRPPADDVERRIVSVLFADLVGFTTLSERLDSEDVATIQDAYFAATRDTISRYAGVVEKFIGDAVMAVFGAPVSRDDDAERAVRAALALIGAVEQLNARLGLETDTLQLRVGVNTGEVVHAVAGPDAGRVTGDTVNTAARLQTAAQPGTVLMGELTTLAVAAAVESVPMGALELKGKAQPIRTWAARALRPVPSRDEALGALRAPTVGRTNELATLREIAARTARDRTSSRIVVVAPPGVGKSRLLDDLTTVLTGSVRRARVRPQATAPYETVAQLFGGVDADGVRAALLRSGATAARASVVAAEIARLRDPGDVSLPAASSSDLAGERDARFAAWSTALDALDDAPATWLVEDVHWAGADLLSFLDHAGRAPTRHGRFVVTTARPSLLETAPAWCATERLDLGGLDTTDASELIRALIGDALPDALTRAVVEQSDGTPLFIEELIRTWASVGTLVADADGRWSLAVHPDAVVLPPTVQAIYAAQLDDLPATARRVARRGSVAGRRVPTGALPALELTEDGPGLDALRRRDFLAGPLDDPTLGEAYAYRHALLRDAGYASLARVERARLHIALARWLEEVAVGRTGVVAEAIAEHYVAASESLPALPPAELPGRADLARLAAGWFELAADAALGLAAHEAAARMLERSIALTDAADTANQARRRRILGRLLAESADLDAGIGHLETAVALCEAALPDVPDEYAAAAYGLASAYMQQIRFVDARALVDRALSALDGAGAHGPAGRARLMSIGAWSAAAQGRVDGVSDELNAAEALVADSGDAIAELDVLEHATTARNEIGDVSGPTWGELAERASHLGRWHLAVVAGRTEAMTRSADAPASALAQITAAAELARTHGLTEQAAWADRARAEVLMVVGDWRAAIDAGLDALAVAERGRYSRLAFRTWATLLPMLAVRCDAALVERYDAWWKANAHQFPPVDSPYARIVHAGIALWRAASRGETPAPPDEELATLDIAFSNAEVLAAVEATVEAWLRAGLLVPARAMARPVDGDATPLMRASQSLLCAMVAHAEGDAETAAEHARAAAERARGIGATWWLARALRILGDPNAEALEDRLRA